MPFHLLQVSPISKPCEKSTAFCDISCQSSANAILSIAAANWAASPFLNITLAPLPDNNSQATGMSEEMTGRPCAIASTSTNGCPSQRELNTKTEALE